MTTSQGSSSDTRMDDAIAWHVRLHSGEESEEDWMAFTVWLEADPGNRHAYERVESLSEELAAQRQEIMARLEKAPHAVDADKTFDGPSRWQAWGSNRWRIAAVAMAASVAILIGLWAALFAGPDLVVLQTEKGQRQQYTLVDGSSLHLNTETKLTVSLDDGMRTVSLIRGEALFNVAHDPERPFIVSLGRQQVRVVGTVFGARRDEGKLAVTVSEGIVEVAPTGALNRAEATARLTAGQQFYQASADEAPEIRAVDPQIILAWSDGRLIYDDATLADIVADLNRYFYTPIEIAEESLADMRFSGILVLDTEDAVLRRLEEFLPVSAVRGDGKILLRPAPSQD